MKTYQENLRSHLERTRGGFFHTLNLCLSLLILTSPGHTDSNIEHHPVNYGVAMGFGQIKHGVVGVTGKDTLENQAISRTGVGIQQSVTINNNLYMAVKIGGLFLYSLPVEDGSPHTRLIKFGPGIGLATGIYHFGDAENSRAKLQFGLFPHKYNPDAKNLGEYQFRSGAYPGYIWNGGWDIINSAAYMGQGVKFTYTQLGGSLTHDVMLFLERGVEPNFDFSPSYQIGFNAGGVAEVGAGITFAHLLSLNEDATTPKNMRNAYANNMALNSYDAGTSWEDPARPLTSTDTSYISYEQDFAHRARVDAENEAAFNTHVASGGSGLFFPAAYNSDSLYLTPRDTELEYYTFRSLKLMGRISLNLGHWINPEVFGPESFKIYSEVAVLGVKDYPTYYENISERMPLMVGLNVPVFGLLDVLSFELEYYNSPYPNSIQGPFWTDHPVPDNGIEQFGKAIDDPWSFDKSDPSLKDDDIKWSLYAKRGLGDHVGLILQVASDNGRVMDFQFNPDPRPTYRSPGDWYYMLRLQFGI